MTKRLRGIWHAWHFQFALSLVVTALCGSFCIACLHPLTRRYVYLYFNGLKFLRSMFFVPMAIRSSYFSNSALSA
ncbi:TPA: DUF3265 domain-containing protein [Vibrio vulnificus]|nr:DUF3265 domain-containing protein [Vibrio vulnificus]